MHPTNNLMKKNGQMKPGTIFIIIILLLVGRAAYISLNDPTVYKGPWYTVKIPPGWEVQKGDKEVTFISPNKDIWTDLPEAVFSVYAHKIEGALFIEDLMTEVRESLANENGKIVDQGEIKIGGQVSRWILFKYEEPALAILTFYMIDDWNRLTKIQVTTIPAKFEEYRMIFDAFKESFKFKGLT